MRGKFGLAVLLLSAVALLAVESQASAGCHRRRARCGGCHTACGTACNTGCDTGCNTGCEAAPAKEAEPQPPAPPAPPAPAADAAAATDAAPQAMQATTAKPTVHYSASTRVRRGWFRR